jgi:hypothetical protein
VTGAPAGPAGRLVSGSIELGVPAAVAFAFVADPSTATVIDPAVREYRPDTVPMGEGTRIAIRLRMWGLPWRGESVVRAWEPDRSMVMESVRPARPVRIVATHRFEPARSRAASGPVDDQRCTYTWEVRVVPSGPPGLGALAARLVARFMRADVAAQQIRLEAALERDERGVADAP